MSQLSLCGYCGVRQVATGHVGGLYRGVRDGSGEVTIRKLDALAIDRDRLRRNFLRQLSAPPHPGVAKLVDFTVDESPYFAAWEWKEEEGIPLSEFPRFDRETDSWEFVGKLAKALAHLHAHGIAHANLHPGTIRVDGEKAPVIFEPGPGFGGKVHHLEPDEAAFYAPPEQLRQPENWDHGSALRWDVYRFGAVVFAWMNGTIPRGRGYASARQDAIEQSGGRPVPIEADALAEELGKAPALCWTETTQVSREDQLRREVVLRCLSLDPAERPVDLREVVDAFARLEVQFAEERAEATLQATIADAEARVLAEKQFQARKLANARLAAAALLGLLIVTAGFLVKFRERSQGYENRASELGLVVNHQRSQLDELDRRWSQIQHDLRTTREAADSVFAQIGQSGKASATEGENPVEGSIEYENLEKSRAFFLDAIAEAEGHPARKLERLRNLQNLAHVEIRFGKQDAARSHLEEAIPGFEELLAKREREVSVVADIESRLADCHETMAGQLIERDPSDEMRHALAQAARYLERVTSRRPGDEALQQRRLAVDYRLACQHHEHREFEQALAKFVDLGERLQILRADSENKGSSVTEMIGEVQLHTARTLRALDRERDAVEAYLAALETFSQETDGISQTDEQCLRLGRIYAELGDIFLASAVSSPAEAEVVLNEALRLISPVSFRRPEHLDTAILFARITSLISGVERDAGRWSSGYRSSLSGIEKLEAALALVPDDLEGRLTLVEMRANHTELLQYQESVALKCLAKGFEMARDLHDELHEDSAAWPEGVHLGARIRLAGAFQTYGELSESLGDHDTAAACFQRATQARELLVKRETEAATADSLTF